MKHELQMLLHFCSSGCCLSLMWGYGTQFENVNICLQHAPPWLVEKQQLNPERAEQNENAWYVIVLFPRMRSGGIEVESGEHARIMPISCAISLLIAAQQVSQSH